MSNEITLYKNHSGTIGYWKASSEGGTVYIEHAKKLDGKATLSQYEAKPKNVGRANETTAEEQAVLEIESRARKQLDKGYVHTQEEATAPSTNTLGLEKPMLATPFDKVKPDSIDWDNAFLQPKLDGHRALFKDGVLYSRQGKAINLPHIVEALNSMRLGQVHLDGELYLHGKSLQEIGSLVKKIQPGTEELVYHVYDVVDSRVQWIERVAPVIDFLNEVNHPSVQALPAYPAEDNETVLSFHEKFLADGYEGTMLRHGTEGYQDGKRSKFLLKLKDFKDAEFTVVGVKEGTPSYVNGEKFMLPVWICQHGDKTFDATAQGTREEKHAQWQVKDEMIGRQLTVKYHYMSKDGIPQLPVALRWREDI